RFTRSEYGTLVRPEASDHGKEGPLSLQKMARKPLLARYLRVASVSVAESDLLEVVTRDAVDEEEQWINSSLVRQFIHGKRIIRLPGGHVLALAIENFAVFLAFRRRGKSSDLDPIVHRNLALVALIIRLEFARLHLDRHVVLPVAALLRLGR